MAGDARSGLKRLNGTLVTHQWHRLNGWGCPFGIETINSRITSYKLRRV